MPGYVLSYFAQGYKKDPAVNSEVCKLTIPIDPNRDAQYFTLDFMWCATPAPSSTKEFYNMELLVDGVVKTQLLITSGPVCYYRFLLYTGKEFTSDVSLRCKEAFKGEIYANITASDASLIGRSVQ